MAAQKSIKTPKRLTFAYTYLKFGSNVVPTLANIEHILDIENIQYDG